MLCSWLVFAAFRYGLAALQVIVGRTNMEKLDTLCHTNNYYYIISSAVALKQYRETARSWSSIYTLKYTNKSSTTVVVRRITLELYQ